MLKAIIFDWDGVIVDSFKLQHQFMKFLCRKYSKRYPFSSLADARKHWYEPFTKLYNSFGFSWKKDEPFIAADFRKFMTKRKIPVVKGIHSVLDKLSKNKFKIAIASSNRDLVIKTVLKKHRLLNYIDKIITIDEVSTPKPSPKIILKCLKQMKTKANEAIYIGDQPVDVTAARKAKVKCIAVSWGWSSKAKLVKARPDYLADSTKQLLNMINSISKL